MNYLFITAYILFMITFFPLQSCGDKTPGSMNKPIVYEVISFEDKLDIDANWLKAEWVGKEALTICNYMGEVPEFNHKVLAKMMYSTTNKCLYLIFRVEDKYILCRTDTINGPVWHDSCVEFFFSPDVDAPLQYFNLEMNCAGIPLMKFNRKPREDATNLDPADIRQVEIATTRPVTGHEEVTGPVTWTLECRIPLNILRKYSSVTDPEPGVTWRANFYKIAAQSSHPHYITWSPVNRPKPDFHVPEDFGVLLFK